MAKSKDKFRCWRSTYSISLIDFFRSELTVREFDVFATLFCDYKFKSFIEDFNCEFLRVRFRGYTLTCQKYVSGIYCIKFNIIKSWTKKTL